MSKASPITSSIIVPNLVQIGAAALSCIRNKQFNRKKHNDLQLQILISNVLIQASDILMLNVL
jgi:hypothetical protein